MKTKGKTVIDQQMRDILDEVTGNMRELYEGVRSEGTDLKTADSLANIAGKILKAQQLILAREMFVSDQGKLKAVKLLQDQSETVPA